MQSTLARLTAVFREVFKDDTLTLSNDTSADDIEGWDSLAHALLVIKIEKAFGVKFTDAQVDLLTDVGEFVELLDGMKDASTSV